MKLVAKLVHSLKLERCGNWGTLL